MEDSSTAISEPLPSNPLQSVRMTWTNLFQYISFTAPILVIFFITLFSIMQNSIVKGIIFNMGLVILSIFVYLIKITLKHEQSSSASPFCNVIPGPFTVNDGGVIYDSPSMSTSILSFASAYIIYPMIINNQQNYSLLVFLVGITTINAVVEYSNKCSNIMGIVSGFGCGTLLGIAYYLILFMSSKDSKLIYFSDTISNNVQCGKPNTNQNFKCEVFKDGRSYKTQTTPG